MKKCFFLVGLLIMSVCSLSQKQLPNDFDPIRQHVAITASYTRNLNAKSFVKELKLVNFSDLALLPLGFGLREVTYTDNGQNYDLIAGDGLYTSVEKFEITPKQAANPVGVSVPVMQNIVVDNAFQHENELGKGEYGRKIIIKCNFYKCGCPCKTFTCRACEWWGWSCWAMDDCSVTFEL